MEQPFSGFELFFIIIAFVIFTIFCVASVCIQPEAKHPEVDVFKPKKLNRKQRVITNPAAQKPLSKSPRSAPWAGVLQAVNVNYSHVSQNELNTSRFIRLLFLYYMMPLWHMHFYMLWMQYTFSPWMKQSLSNILHKGRNISLTATSADISIKMCFDAKSSLCLLTLTSFHYNSRVNL